MADLVPTGNERLPERYQRRAIQIAERVREIDALCQRCDAAQIGEALKRMRKQFRPQPDTEARDMAEGFREACSDLPGWAVSEAANDFLAGRVPNHTGQFMPTCAEFARRAREIISPFLSERASLRIEAEKLVHRWQEEERQNRIAIERADPAVRKRAEAILAQAKLGQPKVLPARSKGIEPGTQSRLDALKKPRPFVSKIGHEPGKAAGE